MAGKGAAVGSAKTKAASASSAITERDSDSEFGALAMARFLPFAQDIAHHLLDLLGPKRLAEVGVDAEAQHFLHALFALLRRDDDDGRDLHEVPFGHLRTISAPFMTGMLMSASTMSTHDLPSRSSASWPLLASRISLTSSPDMMTALHTMRRETGESSTTRMR
jgi:hypothetical protein